MRGAIGPCEEKPASFPSDRMDIGGKDDISECSQPSYDSDAVGSEEGGFEDYDERWFPEFQSGIVRVPLRLLHSMATTAQTIAPRHIDGFYPYYYDESTRLAEIWMKAIAENFPDTPLREIREIDPSLLPRWLLEKCADDEGLVVLGPGGIFARRDYIIERDREPGPKAEPLLAAVLQCRFRKGCASEGMLCNDPPIPLRVLDFLEHAEDLLNLALVCKATHQAGHMLLQREVRWPPALPHALGKSVREFRHDLYSNGIGDIKCAIRLRKKSMVESAMRHPMPNTTASSCAPALKAGTGTLTGADADDSDHLYQSLAIMADQTCLDRVMFLLLWAEKSPEPDPLMPPPLINQVDPVLPDGMLGPDQYYKIGRRSPVVLDEEAVKRAAAMLEVLDLGTSDATDCLRREARRVMQVVHAAKREGQGLILHGDFFYDDEC